jgi:hypothetical protein
LGRIFMGIARYRRRPGRHVPEPFEKPTEPSSRVGVVRGQSTRDDAKEAPVAMYSIFYLIGVVVVVLAILSLLGLA